MIKVYVSDYCQDCPSFYPELDTIYGDNGAVLHHITCNEKDKCRLIRLHLEKEMKEKKDVTSEKM